MPELPEVETHVRDLQPLVGYTIRELVSNTPKAFQPGFSQFRTAVLGKKIRAIHRRAKYIIFELGTEVLIAHFRMTGHFLIRKPTDPLEKCVRHRFELHKGKAVIDLRFDDIRKFGTLKLFPADQYIEQSGLSVLGPEPLDRRFTLSVFQRLMVGKKGMLKAVLLDQSFVAGIGNIYADEICFTSGLHPASRVEKLTALQIKKIHAAIIHELAQGVKNRGTTVGEFVDSQGHSGGNQHTLRAYKRHGLSCKVCGTTMQKMKIQQRTTSYCPKCQERI